MPSPNRAARAVSTSLLAAALVAVPLCAQAAAAPAAAQPAAAAARTVKTLVVGIDGASFDFLEPAGMPTLAGLRAAGLTASSNLYAQPMAGTISGAGWSSIATGVWPDKHRVVDNSFSDPNSAEYPDYLTRIEAAAPERETLVVGTWTPIPQTVFGPAVDERVAGGDDAGTTAKVVQALSTGDPDDVFVHLDEVDGAGHSVGTNGTAYGEALRRADAQLGEILAAIDGRATRAAEDWLIVVTADHGHTPTGGHGGNSPAERKTFVIAAGPGIEAGSVRHDVKITDIAPTVLAADGIANDPAWDLDGTAIGELEGDDFDTLRPVLKPQQDETRPGAGVLGWTHETPSGWTIDNTKMPAGGVAEWAGWSFATDDFWTGAERGQMRETSVRNRDVFAVADSDEWDDKAHDPGQFDSTLVSPAYPLTGAATATLAYATNYFIDGPQSAEVSVSFDGGEPQSLKNYRIDTNRFERLEFDVPAGARAAQFRFHYTGTNSAFWTVDQVRLEQAPAPAITAPDAPTGVTATARDGRIDVSWTAPESDGGSPITGYTATATPVAAAQGADASTASRSAATAAAPLNCTTGGTSCTIEDAVNGTAYTVRVVAANAAGASADSEPSAEVTPKAATTPPVDPGTGGGTGGTGGSTGSGTGSGSGSAGTDGDASGSLASTGTAWALPLAGLAATGLLGGLGLLAVRRRRLSAS
ncbi:alkaline phosphatase family protein [Agromyces soli]|uniref:Alkaline phosphatase family protein n=1 Tax=Agromyces soli TaxID=659012 RepID=A0ABY4AVY5_9MICO|nr:alkaline phosphatase family protein [Agromyces soli]UOE27357.1 alkaline phosphatase family protein [Agromyces soli]